MCGLGFALFTIAFNAPNHLLPYQTTISKFSERRFQPFASKISCKLNEEIEPASYLSALSLPMHPNPNLSPEDVVYTVCKGLQYNDVPTLNTGACNDLFLRLSPTQLYCFRTGTLLPLRRFFMSIGYHRKTGRSIFGSIPCVSHG